MKNLYSKLLTFLGSITLFSMVISLAGIIFVSIKNPKVPQNSYLELFLDGPIEEKETKSLQSLLKPKMTFRTILKTLDHAGQDPKILGVLVRLNVQSSIGLGHSQELRNALKKLAKKGKHVVVHSDTFGENTSGLEAYYLASACQEIWVQPLGSLNITGFAVEIPFLKKFLDNYGVNARILRREGYKTAMDFLTHEELSSQNREDLENVLTHRLQQITKDISEDRILNLSQVRNYIDLAPIAKPQTAKEMGLVDQIGYIEDLYNTLCRKAKTSVQFIPFKNYSANLPKETGKQKIALIYAVGPIMRSSGGINPLSLEGSTNAEEVRKAFGDALKDPNVKAIVFRIDSPGGSAVASDTIYGAIEQAKIKGIPVIASMANVAASGGYMVALPANKIVANPATLTGSIGVYGGKMVTQSLWEKLKINWQGVKIGQKAFMWNSVKDYAPDELSAMNETLDHIYEVFMKRVSEVRKIPLDEVRKVAQGHVWTGDEALEKGLIDALGDLDVAINLAKKEAGLQQSDAVKLEVFPRDNTVVESVKALLAGEPLVLAFNSLFRNLMYSFKVFTNHYLYSPIVAYIEDK